MHKSSTAGFTRPANIFDTRDAAHGVPRNFVCPVCVVGGVVTVADWFVPVYFVAKASEDVIKLRAVAFSLTGVNMLASASDARPPVAVAANDAAAGEDVLCIVAGVIRDAGFEPDSPVVLGPGGILAHNASGTQIGFSDASGDIFCVLGGGGGGGGGGGSGGGGLSVVATQAALKAIPAPDDGMAVVTLHDAAVNIYSAALGRWRKLQEHPTDQFVEITADATLEHGKIGVVRAQCTVTLKNSPGAKITLKHAVPRMTNTLVPAVRVVPESGTIDGATSSVLEFYMQASTIVCDGTNWYNI